MAVVKDVVTSGGLIDTYERADGAVLYSPLMVEEVYRSLEQLRKEISILVIEHHLDVIKTADCVIDLGPEGGEGGGRVVGSGTPEEIARLPASHTGRYLRKVLDLSA